MIREGTRLWHLFRWLCPRKQAYCVAFSTPEGKAVLRDLAKLCFATAPTKNEREQGRRDVWLHISRFLQLSEEELAVLYAALSPEERYQTWKPSVTYFEGEA